MNVLHYALGFPPYRSGGLTKLCVDLMIQQSKEGKRVALLWPGKMGSLNKKTAVKNRGFVNIESIQILSFEVINPLPVSYDEGIADFDAFTQNADQNVYRQLMDCYEPDVIHIHTLMGLHSSFLDAARQFGARIVFTAHDFFPVCPKVTMFHAGGICVSADSCSECGVCNSTALGMRKIQVLQSPLYRRMKDSAIIKKLRKQHRDAYLSEKTAEENVRAVGTAENFKKLRSYYGSFLERMDIIHYNSTITKRIYERFFVLPESCVIGITHSDISDHREVKHFSDDKLRIRYLGPNGAAKGFYLLKAALDMLWEERRDFCLDIHFIPTEMSPYMNAHERYNYNDLQTIFENTDVLIAPSIWYETFGFTVLEALSYGVPVIISGNVGAKDILVEGGGIIVEDISPEKLCDAVRNLTADKLSVMNRIIVKNQQIMEISQLSELLERQCYVPEP